MTVWHGDITKLTVDTVVNFANVRPLGREQARKAPFLTAPLNAGVRNALLLGRFFCILRSVTCCGEFGSGKKSKNNSNHYSDDRFDNGCRLNRLSHFLCGDVIVEKRVPEHTPCDFLD
jgi:hypothetical protein